MLASLKINGTCSEGKELITLDISVFYKRPLITCTNMQLIKTLDYEVWIVLEKLNLLNL